MEEAEAASRGFPLRKHLPHQGEEFRQSVDSVKYGGHSVLFSKFKPSARNPSLQIPTRLPRPSPLTCIKANLADSKPTDLRVHPLLQAIEFCFDSVGRLDSVGRIAPGERVAR